MYTIYELLILKMALCPESSEKRVYVEMFPYQLILLMLLNVSLYVSWKNNILEYTFSKWLILLNDLCRVTCAVSIAPTRWILVEQDCFHPRGCRLVRDRRPKPLWISAGDDCKICNTCHCKLPLILVADPGIEDIFRSARPEFSFHAINRHCTKEERKMDFFQSLNWGHLCNFNCFIIQLLWIYLIGVDERLA